MVRSHHLWYLLLLLLLLLLRDVAVGGGFRISELWGNLKECFVFSNSTLSSFVLMSIIRTRSNLVIFKNRNVK